MSSSGSHSAFNDFKHEGMWEKISHMFVIENIESCFTADIDIRKSPVFCNKQCDCQWTLLLYFPESFSTTPAKGYFGIYFVSTVIPKNVICVNYIHSFKNSTDEIIRTVTGHTYFDNRNTATEIEISERIEMSTLPLKPDKILKIHTEIFFKVHTFELEDDSKVRLQESMDGLFESSKLADVVFEVEAEKLKAHGLILSARSPVFAAMFTHESIEKHSGVVKIVDFDSNNFRLFLRFVYSGKVDIPSVENAIELYRAGEKYDFPDLKLLCTNFMSTHICSSNVGPVLLLAETFGDEDLKNAAINHLLQNVEFFCDAKMDVYKLLQEKNPELLTELLITEMKKFAIKT